MFWTLKGRGLYTLETSIKEGRKREDITLIPTLPRFYTHFFPTSI